MLVNTTHQALSIYISRFDLSLLLWCSHLLRISFWSSDESAFIDSITNSEIDSDSEYNDKTAVRCANFSDTDEESELSDSLGVTNNTIVSTNHGIRLCNNVKEELSNAYFKVNINKENKLLHK